MPQIPKFYFSTDVLLSLTYVRKLLAADTLNEPNTLFSEHSLNLLNHVVSSVHCLTHTTVLRALFQLVTIPPQH